MKDTVKLKKYVFLAQFAYGKSESVDKNLEFSRTTAYVVAEGKTRIWKEFGEFMKTDFWVGLCKVLANYFWTQERIGASQ